MPSEPCCSVNATLPQCDALQDAIHDATPPAGHDAMPPAGCDAPQDVICVAASVQAEHKALQKSIHDAEEHLCDLKVYSDLHTADNAMQ